MEQEIFEIISHAGDSRGYAYEALDAAENKDFTEAETLMKKAEEELG